MLGFIVGLGIAALLPLLLLAVTFDIVVFMFAFGFKALRLGLRILFTILGVLGLFFTIPLVIALIVLI